MDYVRQLKMTDIKLLLFYRSPNQKSEDIVKVREYFSNVIDPDIKIVGALNIKEANWHTRILKALPTHREEKQDLVTEILHK